MAATETELHIFRSSDDPDLSKILQNLANPVKTSSQTSFKREFGLLKSKSPAAGTLTHHNGIHAVIKRCCEEKKFWPAAELEYLLSQQFVSSRNLQMVVESLSQRREVAIMHAALKSQPGGDVPEPCLVTALQSFLSADEKTLEKAAEELQISKHGDKGAGPYGDEGAEPCPFSAPRSAFVDQILLAGYDEVYLVSSLKKLPFALVLEMLKYMLHRSKSATDQEYREKLILWTGHFIDAHGSQLTLAKDAYSILRELKDELDSQIEFVRMAEELAPLLKQALSRTPFQPIEPRPQAKYWIESLHL